MDIVGLNTDIGADSAHVVNSHSLANCNLMADRLLGRIGSMEVRLASSRDEIKAAQALRYKIFVEEMGAKLPKDAVSNRLEFDHYDENCSHFILIDTDISGPVSAQIIGTYRLMRQDVAHNTDGFYSQNEYDVSTLVKRHKTKRFVELGRSCVVKEYRSRRSIELLWQGIWSYICHNNIDVMFGCASFSGTIPAAHAQALSFLHHFAQTNDDWAVKANPTIAHSMDLMPAEAISSRTAFSAMPPLIKGYLRVGAMTAPQAVIDHAFNTTDVFIVLPISNISERYINHYRSNAERFSS